MINSSFAPALGRFSMKANDQNDQLVELIRSKTPCSKTQWTLAGAAPSGCRQFHYSALVGLTKQAFTRILVKNSLRWRVPNAGVRKIHFLGSTFLPIDPAILPVAAPLVP